MSFLVTIKILVMKISQSQLVYAIISVLLGMVSIHMGLSKENASSAPVFSFLAILSAVVSASYGGIKLSPFLLLVILADIGVILLAIIYVPNKIPSIGFWSAPFWILTVFGGLLIPQWKKDFQKLKLRKSEPSSDEHKNGLTDDQIVAKSCELKPQEEAIFAVNGKINTLGLAGLTMQIALKKKTHHFSQSLVSETVLIKSIYSSLFSSM